MTYSSDRVFERSSTANDSKLCAKFVETRTEVNDFTYEIQENVCNTQMLVFL